MVKEQITITAGQVGKLETDRYTIRQIVKQTDTHIYTYTHIHIYIHRQIDKQTDTQSDRHGKIQATEQNVCSYTFKHQITDFLFDHYYFTFNFFLV